MKIDEFIENEYYFAPICSGINWPFSSSPNRGAVVLQEDGLLRIWVALRAAVFQYENHYTLVESASVNNFHSLCWGEDLIADTEESYELTLGF